MIDFRCTFLVVTSGKPSARSKRIWWPKIERVPVPVRSVFSTPVSRTSLQQIEILLHGANLADTPLRMAAA